MQFNPTLGLSRFIGRREGRRIPGRVPQELLVSTLGPVLDLSSGGMRVLATRPPQAERLEMSLRSGDLGVKLHVRVAWYRRLGFRRHEIGLSFLNVDSDMAKILARISSDHRPRQVG
jgi:PilZ domain